MELTNEFSVAARVDQAWAALLDLERIARCMPGATLTSFDGEAFTGTVKVKLGPANLTYAGTGRFVSRDEAAHRVVIEASGKDRRGTGTAAATVTGTLSADGTGTRVHVLTDLHVTGAPAQFGRGMIADVAGRLVGQFADCLATTLAGEPSVPIERSAALPVADARSGVEPIDLLAVSGVSRVVRRAAPYVLVFLAGAVAGAALVALLS